MPGIDRYRLPKIQFITHPTGNYTLAESALVALSCGIKWIQFRCKSEYDETILQQARTVRDLCRRHKALFVVDDRLDIALSLQADGVHLGKDDMPIAQARKAAGPDFLIGGTANTIDDIARICKEGADYVGLGPFRFTQTKAKLSPILGMEGYRKLIDQSRTRGFDLPIYAIGGIRPEDAPGLKACGVYGLAVSSALLQAADPKKETERFSRAFIRNA